jgi:hypothetical protein
VLSGYQPTYGGGPYDAFLSNIQVEPLSVIQTFAQSLNSDDYNQLLQPSAGPFLRRTLDRVAEYLAEGDVVAASKNLRALVQRWNGLGRQGANETPSAEGLKQLKEALRAILDEVNALD